MKTEIRTEEWRVLYAQADSFKRLRCWEWMHDDQLIGLVDPVTGETGYCCVLGAAGEVFALVVYRGPAGLEVYSKSQAGALDLEDAIFVQDALMASLDPRDALEDRDRAVIRSLGLKYRGANDWPLFRSYLPGYRPWYLTREEACFLTHALRQTVEVASRLKDEPDLLVPPESGHLFMRIPSFRDGAIGWSDAWRVPDRAVPAPAALPEESEERLEAIRASASPSGIDWEIDFFYAPVPVREPGGQRPFFPRAYCCMERKNGMSLDLQIAAEGMDNRRHFRDEWLKLVERTGSLPRTVFVKRGEVYDVFETVARKLGIGIAIDENPMLVDEFRRAMGRHFRVE
jgi:hypothetical protein